MDEENDNIQSIQVAALIHRTGPFDLCVSQIGGYRYYALLLAGGFSPPNCLLDDPEQYYQKWD